MPGERRKLYWDACVFLSYIEEVDERMPILDSLLADSALTYGDIEIVTSMLTVAEVAFAPFEKANKVLDPDIEKKIEGLWIPGGAVRLIEFHYSLAEGARDLVRMAVFNGWRLKPPDAIHLASAKAMGVEEFHTYNLNELQKFATT
ncbi:MAG: PIN domain-containing protein [Chloroflexi bacterium]|nr:PIN domain-containing protein [Chloroflexota bacterium]